MKFYRSRLLTSIHNQPFIKGHPRKDVIFYQFLLRPKTRRSKTKNPLVAAGAYIMGIKARESWHFLSAGSTTGSYISNTPFSFQLRFFIPFIPCFPGFFFHFFAHLVPPFTDIIQHSFKNPLKHLPFMHTTPHRGHRCSPSKTNVHPGLVMSEYRWFEGSCPTWLWSWDKTSGDLLEISSPLYSRFFVFFFFSLLDFFPVFIRHMATPSFPWMKCFYFLIRTDPVLYCLAPLLCPSVHLSSWSPAFRKLLL